MPHQRASSEAEQEHGGVGERASAGGGSSKDSAGGLQPVADAAPLVLQEFDARWSPRVDGNGSPASSLPAGDARAFLPYNDKADNPKVIGKFLLGKAAGQGRELMGAEIPAGSPLSPLLRPRPCSP